MKKVYFIHPEPHGSAADFFIKTKREITEDTARTKMGEYDYWLPSCVYVKVFLKKHPEYKYVGSSDYHHLYGWGVNLYNLERKGWTRIHAPEVYIYG